MHHPLRSDTFVEFQRIVFEQLPVKFIFSFKTEFSKNNNILLNFENVPLDISTVEFHTYAAADLLYDMIFAMISDNK